MFEKEESFFICKTLSFTKSISGHMERKFSHTANIMQTKVQKKFSSKSE